MNNNSSLWIGIIVVIVLVLGGFWLYNRDTTGSSPTATSTPSGTTGDETTTVGGGKAPVATTAALASPTSSTTVIVSGTVMPNGLPTTFWFEYGTTTSFGLVVPAKSVEAGQKTVAEATYLVDLMSGKQYYFRIGAKNSKGVSYGGVYSFITPSK
ncbi:MAG: hypothetical protein Q7R54_00895 [bacterium]|nr:hypothetical protein [bacterium]